MDPWRRCHNFTDAVLDAFIKGFPSHPDHATAVAEFERRRAERERRAQASSPKTKTISTGKASLKRAIGWVAPLRLRLLP
jgi:hypothetical protein